MPTTQHTRTMWFLDNTAVVHHEPADDGFSLIEFCGRPGSTVPLHVHDEDETFAVLEGELTARVGDETVVVAAGRVVTTPLGVPHAYVVSSESTARWLVFTAPGRFGEFVAELARPAEWDGLPEPSGPPTGEQLGALVETAAAHGIEILGPPPFAA